MRTILLDPQTWDLTVDASRNIALAAEPYAVAQDAASAARLVKGELWYDVAQGIAYFASVLGRYMPLPFLRSQLRRAALAVPGVTTATATLSVVGTKLTGQLVVRYAAANGAPAGAAIIQVRA